MITNDRQYKIVKSQIEQFQQSLDNLALDPGQLKDIHPKILEANKKRHFFPAGEPDGRSTGV